MQSMDDLQVKLCELQMIMGEQIHSLRAKNTMPVVWDNILNLDSNIGNQDSQADVLVYLNIVKLKFVIQK